MVEYIYYTGIGAKKSGKHTVEEFLDIMNENFNIECSEFLSDLDYKPCREYNEMHKNAEAYYDTINNKLTYKVNSNNKKYKKLSKKCMKYKKTQKKRNCNLEEYIKFSGAEKRKSGTVRTMTMQNAGRRIHRNRRTRRTRRNRSLSSKL